MQFVQVGQYWETQFRERANYNGVAWYRLDFDLTTPEQRSGKAVLELGGIDDESWTYLNGKLVNEVTKETHPNNYWQAPREIVLKQEYLRPGPRQSLVIRCNDLRGDGGMNHLPKLRFGTYNCFYVDEPIKSDDPYRYYHW